MNESDVIMEWQTAKSNVSWCDRDPSFQLDPPFLWEAGSTEGPAGWGGGKLWRLPAWVIPGYGQGSVGSGVHALTTNIGEGEAVLALEPGLGDVGDHLGLPPDHRAGGGGGKEAVQRRHAGGPGATRTLNTTSLRFLPG